jgi:hypothetical protein
VREGKRGGREERRRVLPPYGHSSLPAVKSSKPLYKPPCLPSASNKRTCLRPLLEALYESPAQLLQENFVLAALLHRK